MAVTEFLRHLTQGYLTEASDGKNEEASKGFQRAAKLVLEGKLTEAQEVAKAAGSLIDESSRITQSSRNIADIIGPKIIGTLKEAGIGEPPTEFLYRLKHLKGRPEPKPGKGREPSPASLTREQKKVVLTTIQYLTARAIFRLTNDPDAVELSLEQSARLIRPDLWKDQNKDKWVILANVQGNFRSVVPKIQTAIGLVIKDKKQQKFPISETALEQLSFTPEMRDLLIRLNAIDAYRGMTLKQLIEYTKSTKPIRLGKAEIKANPIPYALSAPEKIYLAKALLGADESLSPQDKKALEGIIKSEPGSTELDQNELEALRQKISTLDKNRDKFFDAQDEGGQLLTAMIMQKGPDFFFKK